jgi:hypothetical protein
VRPSRHLCDLSERARPRGTPCNRTLQGTPRLRSAAGTRECAACRPRPGARAEQCPKAANFAEGCHSQKCEAKEYLGS